MDLKTELPQLNVYRVGYHPDDRQDKPFKSLIIPKELINNDNKYQSHQIYCESVFGSMHLFVDGRDETHKITKFDNPNTNPYSSPDLNLNPVGHGGDFISFPMVADIGFSVEPGQKASFSGVEVRNFRNPSNTLFAEDLSNPQTYKGAFSKITKMNESGLKIGDHSYLIDGGKKGSLIIADPSKNSMPMVRTTFTSEDKKIAKARLYVTARGIYEMYLNGKQVGNDYFNPGLTQYNKTHLYQTYDVAELIKSGKNAIGAMLGEGWWSGNITYSGQNWNFFGDRQSLLAKLVITYADGSTKVVTHKSRTVVLFQQWATCLWKFFPGRSL